MPVCSLIASVIEIRLNPGAKEILFPLYSKSYVPQTLIAALEIIPSVKSIIPSRSLNAL